MTVYRMPDGELVQTRLDEKGVERTWDGKIFVSPYVKRIPDVENLVARPIAKRMSNGKIVMVPKTDNLMNYEQALPSGYKIEEYELVKVLGIGGFGITYLGYDTNLDILVVIKEYLPIEFGYRRGDNSVVAKSSSDQSDFDWGLESFASEAKRLAYLRHPIFIEAHRYFEENHTAYIIKEYVEGDTLLEQLKQNNSNYTEQDLKALLYPILDGLGELHQQNIIHRDITPGNILIRDDGRGPCFANSRDILDLKNKSIPICINEGYSPIEQYYNSGEQGAWTDIYALGAIAYKCLTGETPISAAARANNDPLIPVVEKAKAQASESFLRSIDAALSPFPEDRPQSIEAWRKMLDGI